MSKFKLGQQWGRGRTVHFTVVFLDGEWLTPEWIADYEEETGEDIADIDTDIIVYEDYDYSEFRHGDDEVGELIDEYGLCDMEVIVKRQAEREWIVKMLEQANIDVNNLIVSDGEVYVGHGECCNYIQSTHAWCSSSMSC